jgi:hypothetical protein
LLTAKGLTGDETQKQQLCDRYGNNPLAVKIVATSIRDLFDGEIGEFLPEDTFVFNGIRRLLDQQFERLSPLEKSIMYWLAINREGTAIAELQSDMVPDGASGKSVGSSRRSVGAIANRERLHLRCWQSSLASTRNNLW